jgi:hypothetical protein
MELQLHAGLILIVSGCGWSASLLGWFTSEEWASGIDWRGGSVGPKTGLENSLTPSHNLTPTTARRLVTIFVSRKIKNYRFKMMLKETVLISCPGICLEGLRNPRKVYRIFDLRVAIHISNLSNICRLIYC